MWAIADFVSMLDFRMSPICLLAQKLARGLSAVEHWHGNAYHNHIGLKFPEFFAWPPGHLAYHFKLAACV
jgi:hypothetical protein